MANDEHQYAEVTVRVSLPVNESSDDDRRMNLIADAVHDAVGSGMAENHGVIETELLFTETPEEAAERKMAEAEGRALAKAERRYERHLEERAGRHLR